MKDIQKTSGTHKKYKPGQLITICKDVFRIAKTKSIYSCLMCNLDSLNKKEWCNYCIDNLHFCYFKLVKKT